MPKRRSPEAQLHKAVVAHLRARAVPGCVWFHVGNGEKRNAITGAKLKAMGTKPGVSDLLLFHDHKFYALELKSSIGRLSEAQAQFLDEWDATGGEYSIVHSLDHALAQLEQWGLLRPALTMRDVLEHVEGLA